MIQKGSSHGGSAELVGMDLPQLSWVWLTLAIKWRFAWGCQSRPTLWLEAPQDWFGRSCQTSAPYPYVYLTTINTLN